MVYCGRRGIKNVPSMLRVGKHQRDYTAKKETLAIRFNESIAQYDGVVSTEVKTIKGVITWIIRTW